MTAQRSTKCYDQRLIDDCNMVILPLEMTRTLDVHKFAIRRALENPRHYAGLPACQRANMVVRATDLGMADAAQRLHVLNQQALIDDDKAAASPTLSLPGVAPRATLGLIIGGLLALAGVVLVAVYQAGILS